MRALLTLILFLGHFAHATKPCSLDFSALCNAVKGTWSDGDGCYQRKCDRELPVEHYQCTQDQDCAGCGASECRWKEEQFSPNLLSAMPDGLRDGSDKHCRKTETMPVAQCKCVNRHCVLADPKVLLDCTQPEDCAPCCGSCLPKKVMDVMDCKSVCLLKNGADLNCSCIQNHCRPKKDSSHKR